MQFSAAGFENAFPGKTLQQVLSTGGGQLIALGRQTVSALLNAAALGSNKFGMTPAAVLTSFNNAYPGTNAAYTTLQDKFESMTDVNGRICPLN